MLNWIKKKRNRKGFTLVELVVVIAILGILSGIAVPRLSSSRKRAAITAHNANVKILMSAATMYIADEGVKDATWTGNENQAWNKYLQEWPAPPNGTGAKDVKGQEVDGTAYKVTISTDGEITVEPDIIDESKSNN